MDIPAEGHHYFLRFSKWISHISGHPLAFGIALATILLWLITGPIFHFSNTWQLVVNTWTNIATFLMVFLIQNSQNRDTQALQLKLDELIRATKGAHNAVMDLEDRTDDELNAAHENYTALAEEARRHLQSRHPAAAGRPSYEPVRPPPGAEVSTRPEEPRREQPADRA